MEDAINYSPITFVWDANVETITGYRLYQSTDLADFELIDTVEDTTVDVTVDILNHRYQWYVTAYLTENEETFESAPSNRVGWYTEQSKGVGF